MFTLCLKVQQVTYMFLYLLDTDRILASFTKKGNWYLESLRKGRSSRFLVSYEIESEIRCPAPLVMLSLHRSKIISLEEQPKTQEKKKKFQSPIVPIFDIVGES